MLPTTTDVLVVGAGPVGLVTAATLTRAGVDVTLVDRAAEGDHTSRAVVVHARTLEMLDRIGAAEPLVARGVPAARIAIRERDRTLLDIRFDDLPTRFPYALAVPQWTTEQVLTERLTSLGGRVLRPYRLMSLADDGDRAVATFADGTTVRARWVVGADGMHSTVRQSAGIGFEGDDEDLSFVLADVRVDSGLPRDELLLFFDRAGVLLWAPLPDGTVRLVAAQEQAPERPDVDHMQALLDARGPRRSRSRITEVVWSSRFRIHHRLATTFRSGRVLLAGDAGHVHSPAGGQGMNLGLRDGVAVGTALAQVLAGGSEAVLDAYSADNRPIAAQVIGFTRRLTRLTTVPARLCPARNAALWLLGHVPVVRRRAALQLSGLVYR
ncbi:MAG TPA: FAD-dependent oxidoreductase [Micromonospora sp.]